MIPTSDLWGGIVKSVARDIVEGLNQAYHVGLIISPFTPGLDLSALTATDLSDTVGLTPIDVAAEVRLFGVDPLTQDHLLTINEPAGSGARCCSNSPF